MLVKLHTANSRGLSSSGSLELLHQLWDGGMHHVSAGALLAPGATDLLCLLALHGERCTSRSETPAVPGEELLPHLRHLELSQAFDSRKLACYYAM